MQGYKAHAPLNPGNYLKGQFVRHGVMGHMPPPAQYVGLIQQLVGQAVLRVVEGGIGDIHVVIL